VNEQTIVLCQGQSEQFLGTTYTAAGQYEVIEPATLADQCDVFWDLTVTVIPIDTIAQYVVLETGESYEFADQIFDESGIYYVLEELEETCDRIVELTVVEESEVLVYVPSAFTPSKDGLNDTFKPVVTLIGDVDLSSFEFEVYSRWGQQVFRTNDYKTVGWNGGAGNNSEYYVQDGVYSWVLRYNTSTGSNGEELKGSVLMVR